MLAVCGVVVGPAASERRIERVGSNQQIPVDVRIVAATKVDLSLKSSQNAFRADLYYRLNVVSIDLPALRERREDIPLLFEHFMLLAASRFGRAQPTVGYEQMHRLMAHSWPGNVRELRNIAECVVLGVHKPIMGEPAGTGAEAGASLVDTVESFERGLIAAELSRHDGNVARSAKALNIAKTTLSDKIRKYHLHRAGDGATVDVDFGDSGLSALS
jgi:DNA-binding NtrC family response regulator